MDLTAGHIADIKTSYKYLGVFQSHMGTIRRRQVRKTASKHYQRIRQILKKQLNEKNMARQDLAWMYL